MTELSEKKCKPCEGGVEPLSLEESQKLLSNISNWDLSINHNSISKTITLDNFKHAISFITKIASIAEQAALQNLKTLYWYAVVSSQFYHFNTGW